MAGRWRDLAGSRADPADPATALPARPSRVQTVALIVIFALVAGGVTAASLLVRPDDARSFALFDGSVLLADAVAPVAVDLASGKPTVRLVDAAAQVGAPRADDVSVVPMAPSSRNAGSAADGGALLLDRRTGQFNLVDATGFVAKKNGGVPLPARSGVTGAFARSAGDGSLAYVVQTGTRGSSVYLVGPGTVQVASSGTTVKPRAYTSFSAQITAAGTVAAGDELWTLAGAGTGRAVRRLSLPVHSSPGAQLRQRDMARVDGAAAITTAGRTVAVASNGQLRLWHGATPVRTLTVPPVPGLDTVLAATGTTTELVFLLHGTHGWYVLSSDRDGRHQRGPLRLAGIGADARLVAPAASEGSLYTADAGSGQLWRIGTDGSSGRVAGVASYPVVTRGGRAIEAGGFDDTTVYARGPRVVINSPNHLMAVVLFTDGSRAPVSFTKSDATTINSGGGAEALARSRNGADQPGAGRPKPAPSPVSPINNQVDCATTSQTPHIPAFGAPAPGSSSVRLSWTYPVTDRTDCVPRTYVVGVRLLDPSGTAPAPPARVTVDGQLGLDLGGLYPSSRYEITVTAYLNGKGTTSAPIRITTGPAGPTAPVAVTAGVDPGGTWNVAWSSCGTATSRCVTATSWRVIPQFCDDTGLSALPATTDVAADPTSAVQPGTQVAGGTGLLGRSLRFRVEGIGADGSVGAPSAATACSTSWAPPDAGALRLSASRPGDVAVGSTTTVTLTLDLGSNATRAAGGVGATVVYSLDGPGGTQTKTATIDGRASSMTQSFDGVRAGATYRATARVSPPGHPGSGVTVDAPSITTRAPWPALALTTSCDPDQIARCDLSARIGGLSDETTGGEKLDLIDGSVRCGNTEAGIDDFDQTSWTVRKQDLSQLDKFYGNCTVTVTLKEDGANPGPLLFGGEPATVSAGVDLGSPATVNPQPGDFAAAWSDQGGASAKVSYTGGNLGFSALTTGWRSTLLAPNGTQCGTDNNPPVPAYVPAGDCARKFGDQTTGWHVVLTYNDTVGGGAHTVDVPVTDGPPPGYLACAPGQFTAGWAAERATGVAAMFDDTGDVSGCTNFHFDLISSAGTPCGSVDGAPPRAVPITCGDPADNGWQVKATWDQPDGDHATTTATVTGDPPTS